MSRLPEGVEGWLSEGQAEVLHDRAAQVRDGGRVVEIGSFRGRSTIVLARAAAPAVEIVAVDPHLGSDRGPQEIAEDRALGDTDVETFRANLAAAGIAERVRHVRERSTEALATLDGDVDLLYVDGAHRYQPALADLRDWGARVRPGGRMLVHDAFSSVGVTLALLRALAFSGAWRYAGRERSLAEYVKEPAGSRLANAGRQLAQLPWFARNVAIKVLILLRLRRGPWPY